jgi:DNA-binding XRE family transcriptional regulator
MTRDRRIAAVRRLPDDGPYTVEVRWMDGRVTRVDLASHLFEFKIYEPVRELAAFERVAVGDDGWILEWPGGIEIASDAVARLAEESEVEGLMSPEEFRVWRTHENLTLEQAARALGLSRRTIAYYESGGIRIPRVVALATQALSSRQPT